MRTGIYFWFNYPIPYIDRLNLIKQTGFDEIMLWWGDQFQDIDGPKERIPVLAAKAGLHIENVHSDFENANLLWVDQLGWQDVVNRYLECIDDCHDYDIPAMVLHLTSGDTPPEPSELGIDRMKRIVDRAEQKNVRIALENLRKPEYLDYVYDRIDSDRLKFCYDSGHENYRSSKSDLLKRHGGKLISLHLHDNDGTEDQHMLPGEGNIAWDDIAAKLKKINYKGTISLEVTNDMPVKYKSMTAEEFLAEAYKRAKWIADMCAG